MTEPAVVQVPRVPDDLDPSRLLGRWHIVATTLSFWRDKRDPAVEYAALPDGRWSDTLSWVDARGRPKTLGGIDRLLQSQPGRFRWRGRGLLAVISSEWAFVDVAEDARWAVTWFSRATLGLTPEGMDVYARAAELPELDDVLAKIAARADLPESAAWYRTLRSQGTPGS
jgi:hypothetical protein